MLPWTLGGWILLATTVPLPEWVEFSVSTPDGRRPCYVHYPGNQPPRQPLPVMMVLHGGGGASARRLAAVTGFNRLADREGFVAAYPAGLDGHWNDGRGQTCGGRFRRPPVADDVGYIARLIEELVRRGDADPTRIYVTGVSNGGMMAHRLGIELADRLAAIAAVIANLPAPLADRRPPRGLPVLMINGTDDPMVPWDGGEVRVLGRGCGRVLSTAQTVEFWRRVRPAATVAAARHHRLPDRDPSDGCRVEVSVYGDPHGPAPVMLVAVHGGGHTLPGGGPSLLARQVGRQCRDFDAAQMIWEFCRPHRAPPSP